MSIDLLYKMMMVFDVEANTILGIKNRTEEPERDMLDDIRQRVITFEPAQQEYLYMHFISCG